MAEMERLVEQDPGIGQLRRGEQSFFRMPGNLASYRMRERAETDYRNAFKYAEAKGRAEGGLEILFSLVRDGLLSVEKASARVGLTRDDFAARMGRRDSGHPPADDGS